MYIMCYNILFIKHKLKKKKMVLCFVSALAFVPYFKECGFLVWNVLRIKLDIHMYIIIIQKMLCPWLVGIYCIFEKNFKKNV